jgi:hypothetical protein
MSRSQVFAPRRRPLGRLSLASPAALSPLILFGLGQVACGTNNNYYETQYVYPARGEGGTSATVPHEEEQPDAGAPAEPDAATDAGPTPAPDAGPDEPPTEDGLPRVNTEPDALAVNVFGETGNHYYFVVSDDQLERMNERYLGGGFPGGPFGGGDIYTPGGGASDAYYVDHLFVSTPGDEPNTADFGKVQVKLVGESTGRPWTTDSLPNFKLDSDEFVEGNRIGGVKHFRLNNALVGSIFREKLTLDLYEKLSYPAPQANYAWVQTSVWGPEISVPYIVVESYKPAFCKQREDALGGGCVNMWEFAGDLGYGAIAYPENCQFSECDSTRALDFEARAVETLPGPGYEEALSEYVDWEAFHRFQCLSWILATGDDVLHNSNNFVMVERADGKFQHLPYSIDISLGQEWYPQVPLAGGSTLARGCQNDPDCWDETLTTCEGVLDEFISANPIAMLDANYALLDSQGMLRDGDQQRYRDLSSYLARRIEELPVELEQNREQGPPPDPIYCDYPYMQCGDACMLPEECYVCEPPPDQPDGGVGGVEGVPADGIGRGVAADVALPDPGAPIPVDPPPPQECIPFIDVYAGPAAPLR